MIPNWYATTWHIGPIPIQVWGFFVALGFIVAIWLTVRRARFLAGGECAPGAEPKDIVDFAAWAIVASMVGARVLFVLDNLSAFSGRPWWSVFAVWEGGSASYGGFIGAVISGLMFVRRRRIDLRRFADLVAIHLPIGWFIGRLGCYSIHDHAGIPCNGAFCVPFPDGTRRLDMGLLDGLGTLAIYPVLLWLSRKPRPPGTLIGVFSAWYGLQRFLLDFLRATPDVFAGTPKYTGLTLAQYLSIILFVLGVALMWSARGVTRRGGLIETESDPLRDRA